MAQGPQVLRNLCLAPAALPAAAPPAASGGFKFGGAAAAAPAPPVAVSEAQKAPPAAAQPATTSAPFQAFKFGPTTPPKSTATTDVRSETPCFRLIQRIKKITFFSYSNRNVKWGKLPTLYFFSKLLFIDRRLFHKFVHFDFLSWKFMVIALLLKTNICFMGPLLTDRL